MPNFPPSAPDYATATEVLPARNRQRINPPEYQAEQPLAQVSFGLTKPIPTRTRFTPPPRTPERCPTRELVDDKSGFRTCRPDGPKAGFASSHRTSGPLCSTAAKCRACASTGRITSECAVPRPESGPPPPLSWVLSPVRASYNSAPRDCSKNKIVSQGDTVVAALLVHGRFHPRHDKTREPKRSL